MKIKTKGLESLQNALSKGVDAGKAIAKLTYKVQAKVQKATPVDTGRLRSSVFTNIKESSGTVATNVVYAPFVEYGTRYMTPRHVSEGSSMRVLGEGPFTYTSKHLEDELKEFEAQIFDTLEDNFGR